GDSPVARTVDEDELIEHWTLIGEELTQLAGKRRPTRLAFALSLNFHQLHGRFPPLPPVHPVNPSTTTTALATRQDSGEETSRRLEDRLVSR
ncbi:MAG: hypothetical protein ACRDRU_15920, partial [Pseudonocardiaceae bacterium]